MLVTAIYWKTFNDGSTSTHLQGPGNGQALCGLDLSGDPLVHDREPERLECGKAHSVTCEHCLDIIEFVKDHVKECIIE